MAQQRFQMSLSVRTIQVSGLISRCKFHYEGKISFDFHFTNCPRSMASAFGSYKMAITILLNLEKVKAFDKLPRYVFHTYYLCN